MPSPTSSLLTGQWLDFHQLADYHASRTATLTPGDIQPEDYIAVYYAGGHGAVWDFPHQAGLQAISRHIYERGGYVASVCHGAAGLLNIRLTGGTLLIQGKKLTGFSNAEEQLAEMDQHVPFLTETELKARGALYVKAAAPWAAFAIEDQRLITGQNPASGGAVADLLLQALSRP